VEEGLFRAAKFTAVLLLFCLAGQLASAELGANARMGGGAQSQNIGEDEATAKDPLLATVLSVAPGLVIHGFGNFYAGNVEDGTKMLSMEILGAGLALWGHNVIHQPQNWGQYFGGDTDQAGYWIKATGVGLIAISWVWDVASASESASSYNKEHSVNFRMETRYDGLELALYHRF
jgi:hypothetical protein